MADEQPQSLVQEYRLEAERIQEDAIHSAKGHFNAADRWAKVNLWIGIPNALLAAAAGISAFKGNDMLAGYLAFAVAAIGALNTFLNPTNTAATHKACGSEYLSLRNKSRIFTNIIVRQGLSPAELSARFEELISKRDDLNSTSPQIPVWAFKKAKEGIDAGQATYKV